MDRTAANSRMDHGAEGARAEWLSAMQSLAEQIEKQQQNSQQMIQELMNTYMQLLNTPRLLPLGAGRAAATVPPTDGPAVDGAGPATTADLPAAGSRAAAVLPTDDPGGAWQLRAAFNIPLSYAKEGLRPPSSPSRATMNLPWKRSPRVWERSQPKSLGRFAITRSATRTERRSWSS